MPDLAVKSTPVTSGENFYRWLGTFFRKTEREIFGDLNGAKFTEILITCTYFSTLCSKQARGPGGFCQHFGVSSRRFNNKSLMILSGIYNLHDVCELRDSWTGLYVAGTGEQHSRRERGDWTNENVQRQKGLNFGCTCLLINIIVICLPTEHLGVQENSWKRVRAFQVELEFGSVGF